MTEIFTAMAFEPISFLQAVALVNGGLYAADATNPAHMGLVIGVAQQGVTDGQLEVVRGGKLQGQFQQGARYYVGAFGKLSTQPTFAGAAWSLCVGTAVDADTLLLRLQPMIMRN